MSVTVRDLMALPCLKEAQVIAGKNGLDKTVSSISVLEYTKPDQRQETLFRNMEFFGSEIVITGFTSVANDVESQCACVQRLAEAGEVGLILFYVGIFMPRVDERLLRIADKYDFSLILMPENRMDLRYSEVITEVMEVIVKDHMEESYFVGEILERVSRLPSHQRSMDTVMKMVSDRIRASLILTDTSLRPVNAVMWPRTRAVESTPRLAAFSAAMEKNPDGIIPFEEGGEQGWVTLIPINIGGSNPLQLFVLKEGEPLPPSMRRQTEETVRLSINMWSKQHGSVVMSEMIRAILKDEPIKMRRLGELFHINVADIHTMWVCHAKEPSELMQLRTEVQKYLSARCKTAVTDLYENSVVAFIDEPMREENDAALAERLRAELQKEGIEATFSLSFHLMNTADVCRDYQMIREMESIARKIYKNRPVLTAEDFRFADRCKTMIDGGQASVHRCLSVLPKEALEEGGEDSALIDTLTIYLLDAARSVNETAERMFVHRNTIKYRLTKLGTYLKHPVNKMPDMIELYYAVAVNRVMNG